MMELYVKNREEWRRWLEENHSTVKGIWLIYYKKHSGKERVPYNDAVEEALCFGWIDGKIKRVNEDYYIQWFTPRRPVSRWSELNISRVQKLIKAGLMRPQGLSVYKEGMKKHQPASDIRSAPDLPVPDDLLNALKNNQTALDNFLNFPPACRKLYLFWLNDAKRAETRKGRIQKIVDRSEKNLKAGMM
jgi:uncharacterized protein YdeI (YjbR/CyaY-like superfamily)